MFSKNGAQFVPILWLLSILLLQSLPSFAGEIDDVPAAAEGTLPVSSGSEDTELPPVSSVSGGESSDPQHPPPNNDDNKIISEDEFGLIEETMSGVPMEKRYGRPINTSLSFKTVSGPGGRSFKSIDGPGGRSFKTVDGPGGRSFKTSSSFKGGADNSDSREQLSSRDHQFAHKVMKPYGTPETISRKVQRSGTGMLYSEDKSMQAVLEFLYTVWEEKDQRLVDHLKLPEEGCFVSFSVKEDIQSKAFLFDVGTWVQPEELEDLEIFEERETGRKKIQKKIVRDEKLKRKQQKKGDLLKGEVTKRVRRGIESEIEEVQETGTGTSITNEASTSETGLQVKDEKKGGDEKKKEEEEEEEEEEELEDFEDEKEPVNLGTYAILRVLQKARRGLGPNPILALKNLPEDGTIKNKGIRAAIDKLFQHIIDACDGKMDEVADKDLKAEDEAEIEYDLNLAGMIERIRKNEGKMESEEDLAFFDKEIHQLMQKMVRSVKNESDQERLEIREKAILARKEIEAESKIGHQWRERLVNKKVNAYEFLKTVRFDINARPAHKLFKKLSAEHFNELNRLAELSTEKLNEEIGDELNSFHTEIADVLVQTKKGWIVKSGDFLVKTATYLGHSVVEGLVWVAKKINLIKSREETSAERENRQAKDAEKKRRLDIKRRAALKEAVALIKQNSECMQLKGPMERAVYGQDKSALLEDMRARLGAQALNSVINTKRFPEGHNLAVLMSVGGSGAIGIFLDVLTIPLIILGLAGAVTPIPFVGWILVYIVNFVFQPLLESATPLVAETFDSAIIKQYLDSLKGQKFWRGLKHFKHTLKGAFESGKIAAVGSLFYNFSMLWSSPWLLPIQFILNVFSTVTSAAQVPIELIKTRDNTMLGIHQQMQNDFLPKLTGEEERALVTQMRAAEDKSLTKFWHNLFGKKPAPARKRHPEEERSAAYITWIEKETWRNMEVEQSSRLAINSMGIGPLISSFVFVFMQIISRSLPTAEAGKDQPKPLITPEEIIKAVGVMVNSPTEMISLTGAIIGANGVGIEKCPWLLSTDEQKNAQLLGLIFQRSREQLLHKLPEPLEISNDEIHRIYNPKVNTMFLGRFFVHGGIWLKKKWDNFMTRKENRMMRLPSNGSSANKQNLIVPNWMPNVVYLITFPRLSTAQSLSPKALALELWLRMEKQRSNQRFHRIYDGIFMRHLFDQDKFPYVEYNGQKIYGSFESIVEQLENGGKQQQPHQNHEERDAIMKEMEEMEIILKKLRHENRAMDFIINDQGLIAEMISTMSQLYPKLVDYEVDHVETWDTMPWQLKRTFELMLGVELNDQLQADQLPTMTDQLQLQAMPKENLMVMQSHLKRVYDFVTKMITQLKETDEFLTGNLPKPVDAMLFGLSVQFFETPLGDENMKKYFDEIKTDSNNALTKFYNRMIDQFMSGKQWHALKAEPWPSNYDFVPNIDGTEKYDGEFKFDLNLGEVKLPERATYNIDEYKKALLEFTTVDNIMEEPEPDVKAIEQEMHNEKVPHPIWGGLWNMKKEWTPAEFERVREERIENKKRELYRENVDKKMLVHYPPVVTALVDNMLDLVWDWAWLKSDLQITEEVATTDLQKVGQETGKVIAKVLDKYMTNRGIRLVENEANNLIFREFVLYDKAGELYEQKSKDAAIEVVEAFYAEEFKKEVADLFNEPVKDGGAKTGAIEKVPLLKKELHEGRQAALKKAIDGSKPTDKSMEQRVNHYVFNQEMSAILGEALGKIYEYGYVEETMLKALGEMPQPKCFKQIFNRQAEALEYIEKNHKRIGRDKSRRELVLRLKRAFDRLINVKAVLKKNCEHTKEITIELAQNIKSIDDTEWVSVLKKTKTELLERKVKKLEAERQLKIRAIKYVYAINTKMQQLVKSRIEAINPHQEKEQIAAELDIMKLIKFSQLFSEKMLIKAEKERNLQGKQLSNKGTVGDPKIAKLVMHFDEQIKWAMTQLVEATSILRTVKPQQENEDEIKEVGAMTTKTGGSAIKVLTKLDSVLELYYDIKKTVVDKIPDERMRTLLQPMLAQLINELKAQRSAISKKQAHLDSTKNIKQLILEQVNSIDLDLIWQNLREEKEMASKWMEGMDHWQQRDRRQFYAFMTPADDLARLAFLARLVDQQHVRAKKKALTGLVGALERDEQFSQQHEQEMRAIRELMANIKGEHEHTKLILRKTLRNVDYSLKTLVLHYDELICEEELAQNWLGKTTFEKLSEFDEYKAMCGQRSKEWVQERLNKIGNENIKKLVLVQLEEFNKKQLANRKFEKIKQTKYPIAKTLLHLSAAYLCQDPQPHSHEMKCGHGHKLSALQKLQSLSPEFNEEDMQQMFEEVKKMVYHSIADYNENFVIREEILRQHGYLLRAEVDKAQEAAAENNVDHWGVDNFVAALQPADGRERQE